MNKKINVLQPNPLNEMNVVVDGVMITSEKKWQLFMDSKGKSFWTIMADKNGDSIIIKLPVQHESADEETIRSSIQCITIEELNAMFPVVVGVKVSVVGGFYSGAEDYNREDIFMVLENADGLKYLEAVYP